LLKWSTWSPSRFFVWGELSYPLWTNSQFVINTVYTLHIHKNSGWYYRTLTHCSPAIVYRNSRMHKNLLLHVTTVKNSSRTGKIHPRASALDGGRWSTRRPGPFTPERDPVPIVWEAAWTPRQKIAPPPGFNPRTVQPLASLYTDWTIPVSNWYVHLLYNVMLWLFPSSFYASWGGGGGARNF